tara:strand:+ start:829 stop:1125 length:297 start_codon:yes stop_codon:yes gene_type:complete
MSKKEQRIFERNSDTGQIRSRKKGDYGNEKIDYPSQDDIIAFNQSQAKEMEEAIDQVINPVRKRIREEVLDELWAANKVNHQGHWYIRMSDIVKIIES